MTNNLSQPILSVSELNARARDLLEQNFPLLWVSGEISNLTVAASGHIYFSLKDEQAQVRCVMFRHKAQYLDWKPANGLHVEARALVTLYEARGEFQLNIEALRHAGLGALYEAFAKLKDKLTKAGLFDLKRKRTIPAFPKKIGIVTSPQAAALRDVLITLCRRNPTIPVIIYPTPVQGEGAGEKIVAALQCANQRCECDVLILCRGGGSIEDLWAFNEEAVAYAIYHSVIPVVCGVGHETDFTIADFVADQRAPTPTGAAELCSPKRSDLLNHIVRIAYHLTSILERSLENKMQRLDLLSGKLTHPGTRIDHQFTSLEHLLQRLNAGITRNIEQSFWKWQKTRHRLNQVKPNLAQPITALNHFTLRLRLAAQAQIKQAHHQLERQQNALMQLSPQAVLDRGYSVVKNEKGEIVRDAASLKVGSALEINFARGKAKTQVQEVEK